MLNRQITAIVAQMDGYEQDFIFNKILAECNKRKSIAFNKMYEEADKRFGADAAQIGEQVDVDILLRQWSARFK